MIPVLALAVAAYEKPNAISRLDSGHDSTRTCGRGQQSGRHRRGRQRDDRHGWMTPTNASSARVILARKTWDIAGFDRVQVRSTFRAEIIKGTDFKVTTTADDNVLPHIQVAKEGTTLKISLDRGSYRLKSPLKAEITLPSTRRASTSVVLRKARSKGFNPSASSRSRSRARASSTGGIAVEKGDFKVDGASTLSLVGSAQAARLSAEGSSHLKLGEFLLKNGQVDLEGASTAEITVKSDALFKAKLSGASTLKGSIQAKEIDARP